MFNITTILTKMVLNYFEVMINYIIAVTLHARRKNLMSLCPYQHYQWWYNIRHEFLLDWLCRHSWTQTTASSMVSLICTCPGLALAMMFLHSFYLWKQMDNKCEWDRKNLFLFYIWRSWAVLCCWITLLLQNIYLVSIVWPIL